MTDSRELPVLLHRAALKYLERFDASAAKLRTLLLKKARALAPEDTPKDELEACVNALVVRFQGSGILDDSRFAASSIRTLRERGMGERAILHRLAAKGIEAQTVREALTRIDADAEQPELAAAIRLVKRRKLGAFRSTPVTPKERKKDLQALARAGFSYEVALRALGAEALDADAF